MNLRSLFLICFATALSASASTAEELVRPNFLPEKLENSKGKKIDSSGLAGKYIGLYFSASWCAPCRAFTPLLKQFRDDHLDEGFEVVLVNFDRSNTDKRRYIRDSGMEWPSVPGARRKASKTLMETYQVSGYPTLIILDPNGNIVTNEGVEAIISEPETVFGQWLKFETPNA
ncbi:MAG: thioredoxin-like domain-containing protein [Verrucomicrobiales bacterium]|nr:thioredoxin-like domain-containing protein [Verrucomicrobiales bacterium]